MSSEKTQHVIKAFQEDGTCLCEDTGWQCHTFRVSVSHPGQPPNQISIEEWSQYCGLQELPEFRSILFLRNTSSSHVKPAKYSTYLAVLHLHPL